MAKKIPIGIDDFKKIRESVFYYVDKTKLIENLINNCGKVNIFTRRVVLVNLLICLC